MKTSSIGALLVSTLCVACSPSGSESSAGEHLATSSEGLSGLPEWGAVPYPVLTKVVSGTTTTVFEADGKTPVQAWDGSLAELVATDAYAQCQTTAALPGGSALYAWAGTGDDDQMARWTALANEATCAPVYYWDSTWMSGRTNGVCNFNSAGNRAVLKPISRDVSLYATYAGYGSNIGTSPYVGWNDQAKGELSFADVNLCVAQQVRQYLNDGNLLFTPAADQLELFSILRTRAQMAMIQYSVIASVFNWATAPSSAIADNSGPWVPLYLWANGLSTANKQKLAADYSAAIHLSIEATTELAKLLQRQAASEGGDRGPYSARGRLLALMYGGDPLTRQGPPYPAGHGAPGPFNYTLPLVTESMKEPQVQTALSLLKGLATIDLKISEATNFARVAVEQTVALRYVDVEAKLRLDLCEASDQTCSEATIRSEIPDLDAFEDYELWRRHRVAPEHMRSAVTALTQALGRGTDQSHDGAGSVRPALHVTGVHSRTYLPDMTGLLHVDPEFAVVPLPSHHLGEYYQSGTYFDPSADRAESYISLSTWGTTREAIYDSYLYAGAIPALAFAKEQIVLGSKAQAFASPFFAGLGVARTSIERAIGTRSTYVRREGSNCSKTVAGATNTVVSVVTRAGDPMISLAKIYTDPLVPTHLTALEIDPNYRAFDNSTKSSPAAVTFTEEALSGTSAGWIVRSGKDTSATNAYYLAADSRSSLVALGNTLSNASGRCAGKYLSQGGQLNEIVDRTWSFKGADWSKPAYDGFGLPVDWNPPANASLVGGGEGEESYQYYLRSAKQAAAEATNAVQKAIDGLSQQALDETELAAAETRAKGITEREMDALCGAPSCKLEYELVTLTVPECEALTGVAATKCATVQFAASVLVPSFVVAKEVSTQLNRATPDFGAYEGSAAGAVMLNQWKSLRVLQANLRDIVAAGAAYGRQVQVSAQARTAAQAKYTAVNSELDDVLEQLEVGNESEVSAALAAKGRLEAAVLSAQNTRDYECGDEAERRAFYAGFGYADAEYPSVEYNQDNGAWKYKTRYVENGRSWSPGPFLAQVDKCYQAERAAADIEKTSKADLDALDQTLAELSAQPHITESQKETLGLKRKAALSEFEATAGAAAQAASSSWAQVTAQLTGLQATVNNAIAASVEYDQIRAETDRAIAAAKLDESLTTANVKVRFGLYRQYRSYEMWRARALLESARRLAVAARRSIEARFVVDLSEMDSQQAFVEAPSSWADDVYQGDLDAPSVVGLSTFDGGGGTIYPNKLEDYIGNLERFVQGYTTSYPTSLANPDTEVLSIPGPDLQRELAAIEEVEEDVYVAVTYPAIAEESAGWSFYCENSDTWIAHPGFGQLPLTSQLSAACGADPPTAPTRARYSFSLDPWGRMNRFISEEPYTERHNVRWRRFAVNIVGTGVRDCARAADPVGCYSDSFLRYELAHSGPAWTSNHERQWRAQELPTAFIEGAKALATEEWLDPISNGWSAPAVSNVARAELFGRPVGGAYELILDLTPDVRPDRIERIQVLAETEYWVRQQ